MSMQQGAKTVDELLNTIRPLAEEMLKHTNCNDAIREIVIRIDEEDGEFLITSD